MKTITLLQIQSEAKKLQNTQNITYNQSLQIIAQQNGFKSYQAILNKIKKDYIDDENEEIKEFKSNVFENRKHIKSNFIKIEKLSKKYDLRPGMGLAAPQLGINKNFFVVCYEVKDGVFDDYILINPKVISYSEEMIYAGEGEGCLSVNREVEGIVPRHARITVEAYDLDGNKRKYRVREDLAIAFQHELDHLNGILFVDYIDPKDPYKNAELYREI